MVTVGCPRIVLKTELDPLTIPPPVFRLPRFGLRDHLIYRAEQSFMFRLVQSPSLVPAKTGSAGVYRKMRVESSGGSPTRHDPPRAESVRGRWKCGGSEGASSGREGYSVSFVPKMYRPSSSRHLRLFTSPSSASTPAPTAAPRRSGNGSSSRRTQKYGQEESDQQENRNGWFVNLNCPG
jgi:hypothetical protein